MFSFKRKHLIWGGALGATAAAVALAMRPDPVVVETDVARVAPMRVTVDAEGRTRVRERYTITAPVTGRLERVRLVEGSAVRPGTVVARLAPPPLDATAEEQASARLSGAAALRRESAARVEQARRAVADARRNAERVVRVVSAGGLPERERESAELALRASESELAAALSRQQAAEAEVRGARATLLAAGGAAPSVVRTVVSPVAGRVLRLPEPSERVVAAGTPILEIGDAGALEIAVDVLSTDAVRIRPGAVVDVVGWGGDAPLRGHVRAVEPSAVTRVSALGVDEQRVDVLIDVDAPPATLGDGFRVEVSIVTWQADRALVVPASALLRDTAGWSVFAVEDGRARRHPVTIGHRGTALVEVLGGIARGDEVVLFPTDAIHDGVKVRAR